MPVADGKDEADVAIDNSVEVRVVHDPDVPAACHALATVVRRQQHLIAGAVTSPASVATFFHQATDGTWPSSLNAGINTLQRLGVTAGSGSLADDGVSLLGEIEVPGLQLSGSWAFSADEGFELHFFPELSSLDTGFQDLTQALSTTFGTPSVNGDAYDLSWERNGILISWRIYGIDSEHPMAMLSMEAASVAKAH